MYFVNAVWYAFSAVGFVSIPVAILLALQIFNQELVEREFGYRNLFIVLGAYGLVALPLAATITGGTGGDFIFFVGCMCPGLVVLSNKLETAYKAGRAVAPAPAPLTAPAQLGPAMPAMARMQDAHVQAQPYAPAPTTLAHDFDVPPQRQP